MRPTQKLFCFAIVISALGIQSIMSNALADHTFDPAQLNAPQLTITTLFTEVLSDPENYKGWKVAGVGVEELMEWKAQIAYVTKANPEWNTIQMSAVTQSPILLNKNNLGFFEFKEGDSKVKWNGSQMGYEYIFDPKTLITHGHLFGLHFHTSQSHPISFYLIKDIPINTPKEQWVSHSSLAYEYYENGRRMDSRGETRVAHAFFKKAALVDPGAMVLVGKRFEMGAGVPQDLQEATQWYEEAARNGNFEALFLLRRPKFKEFVHAWVERQKSSPQFSISHTDGLSNISCLKLESSISHLQSSEGTSVSLQPGRDSPLTQSGQEQPGADSSPESGHQPGTQNSCMTQSGEIFVSLGNDPVLGEAWLSPSKVIWYDIARTPRGKSRLMGQIDAMNFCASQTPPARLPTRENFHELAQQLGVGNVSGYSPQPLSSLKGNWFWSESTHDYNPDSGFYFNGSKGTIDSTPRRSPLVVRCVRYYR